MCLHKNIRYLRKKQGMSQDVLADMLGYKSYTTIQKWEMGVSEPPVKQLRRMAEIFGVDIDDMAKIDMEKRDLNIGIEPAGQGVPDERLIKSISRILQMLSDAGKTQVEDFANSVLKIENMQKQVQEPQLLAAHKIENTGMTDEELAKVEADDLELLRKFHDMDAKTE